MKNEQDYSAQGFGRGMVAMIAFICVGFGVAAGIFATTMLGPTAPAAAPAPAADQNQTQYPAPAISPPGVAVEPAVSRAEAAGAPASAPAAANAAAAGAGGLRLLYGLQIAFDLLAVGAIGWLYGHQRRPAPREIGYLSKDAGHGVDEGSHSIANAIASLHGELAQWRQASATSPHAAEPALNDSALPRTDFDDFKRGLEKTLNSFERTLATVQKKSLEDYFNEWQREKLTPERAQDVQQALDDFVANPDVVRTVADLRQVLGRVRDKTGPLVQQLQQWMAMPTVQTATASAPALAKSVAGLRAFLERGQGLVKKAGELEQRLQLSGIGPEAGGGLRLFDVVSGRSAGLLGGGYKHRLSEHLQRTELDARALADEAEKYRAELPPLLDGFYREEETLVPANGGRLNLRLKEALAAAKINEILVEAGRTKFDAAMHEPLAGATEPRLDLPPNTIIRVDRRGFTFEGKTLRPARVVLSSAPGAR